MEITGNEKKGITMKTIEMLFKTYPKVDALALHKDGTIIGYHYLDDVEDFDKFPEDDITYNAKRDVWEENDLMDWYIQIYVNNGTEFSPELFVRKQKKCLKLNTWYGDENMEVIATDNREINNYRYPMQAWIYNTDIRTKHTYHYGKKTNITINEVYNLHIPAGSVIHYTENVSDIHKVVNKLLSNNGGKNETA